jgi:hypothetical protein
MRYVRYEGSGDGFDYDNRYSSSSSPRDRQIAELRYAAAAATEQLKSLLAAAPDQQSTQTARGIAEFDDSQEHTGIGGHSHRRQTLGDGNQGRPIPDNSWVEDPNLVGNFTYDADGRPRQNQGRAATGKFPGQAHFSDGSQVRVRRYRRPAHLQREFENFAADIGSPILRYDDAELAGLGLHKAPLQSGLIF